ncbi:MAG: hypothetical protein KKD48_05090 [Nanoarchaeota archaeon]|nr:hypothetical protein [Nanoarchaeota archaeon]
MITQEQKQRNIEFNLSDSDLERCIPISKDSEAKFYQIFNEIYKIDSVNEYFISQGGNA